MKLIVVAWAAASLAVSAARADSVSADQASEADLPKIGDIMTMQQMRHIKLWFAGRADNWPLADYELGKLKDGFDDVNKQLGGDLVEKTVGPGLEALEKAIDAKDRAAFSDAFDRLSAGCSSCHRTLDHAYIVIQRPASQPYSDQSFAPPK